MDITYHNISGFRSRSLEPELFSAHVILRAIITLAIWVLLPDKRMTLLPFAVATIYLLTVIAILVDTSRANRS